MTKVMALINCPECKKEVSNSAATCPHCGYSIKAEFEKPKKKKKDYLTWVLFFIAIILAIFYFYSKNSPSSSPSNSLLTSSVNVTVENVRISKDFSTAWGVKGSIRNNTTRPLKGAVKIKFINSNGDIVHTNRAYVNDGDPFDSGQAANFEYFVPPKTFNGVVDFKVEFYEN